MKKSVAFGVMICAIGILGILATSYFDSSLNFSVKTDHAIVLTLDQTAGTNLTLTEEGVIYSVTAKIDKSSGNTENANATLKLEINNGSDGKTLENVVFEIYKKSDCENKTDTESSNTVNTDTEAGVTATSDTENEVTATALKQITGTGSIEVTGINDTTEYIVKIYLKPKNNNERYTAKELQDIGGSMVFSFSSTGGAA